MTFNKTIDLMRQVWEMLTHVKPEHPLRVRLRQAEGLLRRDIVEHSLLLGFAPIALPEVNSEDLEAVRAERPGPRPRSRTRGKTEPEEQDTSRRTRGRRKVEVNETESNEARREVSTRGQRKSGRTSGKKDAPDGANASRSRRRDNSRTAAP
jgi:hypothetical protein